ncbi:MAG: DinB family protein [Thermomicrobiales bacterium]
MDDTDLIGSVTAILRVGPARWRTLAEAVDPARLERAPAPGEWSAANVLQHLIDVEPVFTSRVEAILAGQAFPAFDQDNGGEVGQPVAEVQALIDRWTVLRERGLAVLATVQPEDLARTAIHAELGEVTLANLLNEWGGHDLMHMVQAEEAIMQPFIAGVGPWRGYFVAHEATLDE